MVIADRSTWLTIRSTRDQSSVLTCEQIHGLHSFFQVTGSCELIDKLDSAVVTTMCRTCTVCTHAIHSPNIQTQGTNGRSRKCPSCAESPHAHEERRMKASSVRADGFLCVSTRHEQRGRSVETL